MFLGLTVPFSSNNMSKTPNVPETWLNQGVNPKPSSYQRNITSFMVKVMHSYASRKRTGRKFSKDQTFWLVSSKVIWDSFKRMTKVVIRPQLEESQMWQTIDRIGDQSKCLIPRKFPDSSFSGWQCYKKWLL